MFLALVTTISNTLFELLTPMMADELQTHMHPALITSAREHVEITAGEAIGATLSASLSESLSYGLGAHLNAALPADVGPRVRTALIRTLTQSLALSVSTTVVRTLHLSAQAHEPHCFACLSQRTFCDLCPAADDALQQELAATAALAAKYGVHFADELAPQEAPSPGPTAL